MATTHTERDMLELLHARYSKTNNGGADQYVRAEHVPVGGRIADFVVVDRWTNMKNDYKNVLIGHEVKVSRSDWLTELRDPVKSWVTKRYMDHWYLVVPDKSIVAPGELPEDWGLLVIDKKGELRMSKKAPRLEPDPLDTKFLSGFAHAVARTAHRAPLHRKSPSRYLYEPNKPIRKVCHWCGSEAPCQYHQ